MKPRVVRDGITASDEYVFVAEDSPLARKLPEFQELKPAHNLQAVFDDCHNYIYANEGLLKNTIFHEMVKLLIMKLHDEKQESNGQVMFGITANEYRELIDTVPSRFISRMNELFLAVRSKYEGLFPESILKLKPISLAYVVRRLQQISLSRTPGDVKGEAFQAFVYKNQRGDRGEFFTPHPVVRLAVKIIAPKLYESVIDPACGSGGFLIQSITHVVKDNAGFDKSTYVRERVHGIEFNPDVALAATIRLVFEGGVGEEISCTNSLLPDTGREGMFDIVLTNPPFGSKGKVEDRQVLEKYALAHRWKKGVKDQWEVTETLLPGQSPDILFIERCLRLLRAGGRMAIVLPDGLLQNISNGHVRSWICSQSKVLAVISIPQEAFVPYGTGIKTSLLVLQKWPAAQIRGTFMARIQKIGYDIKGQPIYRNGNGISSRIEGEIIDDDIDDIASAYDSFASGAAPDWGEQIYTVTEDLSKSRFDAEYHQPRDQELLKQLQGAGAKPLGAVAHILDEVDDFRTLLGSEIRYIAISDVDYLTMQVVSKQIIKACEAPSRATYRLKAGDILTATAGASTGTERQATALVTQEEEGAICSNGFAVLRDVHGVEPLFLLAYMRTEFYLRQVRRLMTGHAIPAVSSGDLARILVPIPPIEEQRAIAERIAGILEMRRSAQKEGSDVVSKTIALVRKVGLRQAEIPVHATTLH